MYDKKISVVVPCFNEEEVLRETHARLLGVMTKVGMPFELVYVDDGSHDGTWEILESFSRSDYRTKAIRLSRNFGHQLAVTAGLDRATGDAVVLIDADLQDPPELIEQMVRRWREGYEVVYGQRTDRQGESAFKLFTAKLFYRMINWLSSVEIPLDTGDFRLMDRKVVRATNSMRELDRFIRGMVSWVGFRQIALPYRRAPRQAGETKYPLFKMVRFALDAVVSFSLVPLRLATLMGFFAAGLSLAGIIYALAVRVGTGDWVTGWASLFVGVLFLGGVQLICLGIMGEYVGRIYREIKQRPLYLVSEELDTEALGTKHEPRSRSAA